MFFSSLQQQSNQRPSLFLRRSLGGHGGCLTDVLHQPTAAEQPEAFSPSQSRCKGPIWGCWLNVLLQPPWTEDQKGGVSIILRRFLLPCKEVAWQIVFARPPRTEDLRGEALIFFRGGLRGGLSVQSMPTNVRLLSRYSFAVLRTEYQRELERPWPYKINLSK